MKKFLRDNDIEYEYIDVDLCDDADRKKIRGDVTRRGGNLAYPTIIIDDQILITGFLEKQIKEALRL